MTSPTEPHNAKTPMATRSVHAFHDQDRKSVV